MATESPMFPLPDPDKDDPQGLVNALRAMADVDEGADVAAWAVQLIRSAADMIEAALLEETYIVMTGDPVDGYSFTGPFLTPAAVEEYMDQSDHDETYWSTTVKAGYPDIT